MTQENELTAITMCCKLWLVLVNCRLVSECLLCISPIEPGLVLVRNDNLVFTDASRLGHMLVFMNCRFITRRRREVDYEIEYIQGAEAVVIIGRSTFGSRGSFSTANQQRYREHDVQTVVSLMVQKCMNGLRICAVRIGIAESDSSSKGSHHKRGAFVKTKGSQTSNHRSSSTDKNTQFTGAGAPPAGDHPTVKSMQRHQ